MTMLIKRTMQSNMQNKLIGMMSSGNASAVGLGLGDKRNTIMNLGKRKPDDLTK